MGLTAKGPPPNPSIASLESPITETGHAESPRWGAVVGDAPMAALAQHFRASVVPHALTTLACENLPGSSRGYYLIATDALRLAQLEGASTTAASHSRGTFVVVAVARTFLPLTPSGLRSR